MSRCAGDLHVRPAAPRFPAPAWPRRARAGPSPLPSPHGFPERHCCHGNARPITPPAENHSSANLSGTRRFRRANAASCLDLGVARWRERKVGALGHRQGGLWAREPFPKPQAGSAVSTSRRTRRSLPGESGAAAWGGTEARRPLSGPGSAGPWACGGAANTCSHLRCGAPGQARGETGEHVASGEDTDGVCFGSEQ